MDTDIKDMVIAVGLIAGAIVVCFFLKQCGENDTRVRAQFMASCVETHQPLECEAAWTGRR